MNDALRTLLAQLVLALVGQPVQGPSRAERRRHARKRERLEAGEVPVGLFGTLRTVAREALYALIAQPSPGAPSSASSRRPRS